MTTIEHNLRVVRARIEAACRACGRDPQSVTLLAVSKTFGLDAIAAARTAGQQAFGENYIQEAVGKITALQQTLPDGLPPPVWHCIGPVQSNKTRLVAEHFDWVHTVDRLKTAQRLNEQRPPGVAPLQVCLQVNVDGGANKSGVAPQEVAELAQHLTELPRLRLRGLMSLPEPAPDFEASKAVFMRVRALFDALNSQGYGLDVLSLGMSGDLEAAIHAGSTLVRVGSAIFGARPRAA